MDSTLLPAIGELEKDSLCYSIYAQLYNNFFNAQDSGTVVEGDWISIRLHNTAYGFAEAIASSVGGGDSEGGVLIGYLKKSGDDMYGKLRANYGFEAGYDNTRVLYTYFEDNQYGVHIDGNLRLGGDSLYIGERNVLRYDAETATITLDAPYIDLLTATLKSSGEMLFGKDKASGVHISSTTVQIKGKDVYHEGNANLSTVDWTMQNAAISSNLTIGGTATLKGELTALYGFTLGYGGDALLVGGKENITANSYLSFGSGYGIKIGGVPVLVRVNDSDIQLSAADGDLLLGSEQTNKIRLFAGVCDIDGDNILISKYGDGYFPASLTVRHNYGEDLLSTYRVDTDDEGMIIHKRLRFGSATGAIISGNSDGITFTSSACNSYLSHRESTSHYKPLDRASTSLYISTDSDFITVGKPLEATTYIGIDGAQTRITVDALQFSDDSYIQAVTDGFKLSGNSVFLGNLSSESFASGFSGYGWSILNNLTTGNTSATFDELTIRKKMRIYELEVQKISATNGSFWVSDSCSGDVVEKI